MWFMRAVFMEVRRVAKELEVKVLFKRLKGAIAGLADYEKGIITINSLLSSRQEILSCFAHEYFHCKAYQDGTWKIYHSTEDDQERMKTALKAERWVDKQARVWLFNYDRRLNYLSSYENLDNKGAREFLKDYYDSEE
jgi:hypothetical protein